MPTPHPQVTFITDIHVSRSKPRDLICNIYNYILVISLSDIRQELYFLIKMFPDQVTFIILLFFYIVHHALEKHDLI